MTQDFSTEAGPESILIEEWIVPYETSRPRDPYTVDGETVWFVGQVTDYIARFDVSEGTFEKIDLQEGDGPHNLIVEPDGGAIWYAGNRAAHIGRYDVDTDEFERIMMPDGHPDDPHTQVFDANGDIWFTGQRANTVSKLDVSGRTVTTLEVPTPDARPYGLRIAPGGTVWVALLGTNKLASIDPDTMTLTEHVLPRAESRPRRLAITSDGRVWYSDYDGSRLGVLDPASGEVEDWLTPSGEGSRPYALARDSADRLWIVETGAQPNLFCGFDPQNETFFSSTQVPSGGGTVRHMQYYAPDGVIWFGADTNTIGRAIVEPGR
ncbi:lyase [Marinicauda algicola]|uniref:Lyase n=1 Tax=Marinicauda algicola TaxID=2029849 RepID=A0A4S2H508_9PROT|nr:lyase [Marinicauda algicola]